MYSCIECARIFSTELGLRGHSAVHKNKPQTNHYRCCSILTGREVTANMLDWHEKRFIENLRSCIACGVQFSHPNQIFCSQRCSGTFNNTGRVRSEASRKKTSDTLKLRNAERGRTPARKRVRAPKPQLSLTCSVCDIEITGRSTKLYCSPKCRRAAKHVPKSCGVFPHTKVDRRTCGECGTDFWAIGKSSKKFCGIQCRNAVASRSMSERLRDPEFRRNYGRQNKSYIERSFDGWLQRHGKVYGVDYDDEVPFKRPNGRYYYADFIFENIKLNIELDGTQHRLTVEQDKIRDEYITSLGYQVVRITAQEYNRKSRIDEIANLLGITLEAAEGIKP